jgi:hypothetical protein
MDIKPLREGGRRRPGAVGAGDEQGFPLPAADAARVFEALAVVPPALGRDGYSLEQFLADLVEPSGAVRPVRVHKRRVRYGLAGCMAEIAEVEADGRIQRTTRSSRRTGPPSWPQCEASAWTATPIPAIHSGAGRPLTTVDRVLPGALEPAPHGASQNHSSRA